MSRILKSLVGAVTIFVLVMLYIVLSQKTGAIEANTIDIGIEHSHTGTLAVSVTRNGSARFIEIGNKNAETFAISLPDNWQRGEVRGVKLQAVVQEKPSFGYVRWHVPGNTTVDFTTQKPFAHLTVHNPIGAPLNIDFTQVDLMQNTGIHDAYLVQSGAIMLP